MLYKEMKKRRAFRTPGTFQKKYIRASEGPIKVHFEQVRLQTSDEKFLSELIEYIKQNLSNPDLSVETTSRDLKMCRVSLYKKVLKLAGKSPVVFIRAIRLQKAVQLPENTEMIISRVASEAGFETPQYFAKLFKKEYDMLPSTYVRFARKVKVEVILNAYGLPCTLEKVGFNNNNITNKLQNLILK